MTPARTASRTPTCRPARPRPPPRPARPAHPDPSPPRPIPVRVVGCGRSQRRDDQAGLRVAELLAARPPERAEVRASQAPGIDLIADLEGVRLLIIVDAVDAAGRAPPGSLRRFVFRDGRPGQGPHADRLPPIRATQTASSHLLGVADALALAAQLDLLPDEVWVYAIAGEDFGYGEGLSPSVARGVRSAAARIRADIARWRARPEPPRA